MFSIFRTCVTPHLLNIRYDIPFNNSVLQTINHILVTFIMFWNFCYHACISLLKKHRKLHKCVKKSFQYKSKWLWWTVIYLFTFLRLFHLHFTCNLGSICEVFWIQSLTEKCDFVGMSNRKSVFSYMSECNLNLFLF